VNNQSLQNQKTKVIFKVLGIFLIIIGAIILIVGVVSFFRPFFSHSVGSFVNPFRYLWIILIGLIITASGIVSLMYAYMGKATHYTNTKIIPVVKETTNSFIDETNTGINNLIDKFKGKKYKVCPNCHQKCDINVKFCGSCGSKLTNTCSKCRSENDLDTSFCISCGNKLKK